MTDQTMMETVGVTVMPRVIMAVMVIKMEMVIAMAPFDHCPMGVAVESSSALQTQSKSLLS